jgi:hypothetical protein
MYRKVPGGTEQDRRDSAIPMQSTTGGLLAEKCADRLALRRQPVSQMSSSAQTTL